MRISDWSSDVCSSDLQGGRRGAFAILDLETGRALQLAEPAFLAGDAPAHRHDRDIDVGRVGRGKLDLDDGVGALQRHDEADRKSVVSGKSVSVRVDLGGRRIIKNKKDRG